MGILNAMKFGKSADVALSNVANLMSLVGNPDSGDSMQQVFTRGMDDLKVRAG